MALPSTRRPVAVEEILNEEIKEKQKEVLKIKLNKTKCFYDMMGSWWRNMRSEKERCRVNTKRFKRRALHYCKALIINYYKLPLEWITVLKQQYGIIITEKKKAKKVVCDDDDSKMETVSVDEHGIKQEDVGKVTFDPSLEVKRKMRQRKVTNVKKSKIETTNKLNATDTQDDGIIRKRKTILDLSNEPPPPEWLEAYSRGIFLDRILKLRCTEDITVIYYDYSPNPSLIESGERRVHEADGFNWWKKEAHKINNWEDDSF